MQFTHEQYNALESAVIQQRRIALVRRGAELVLIPRRLRVEGSREILEATHPTTGDPLEMPLDEIQRFEVLR